MVITSGHLALYILYTIFVNETKSYCRIVLRFHYNSLSQGINWRAHIYKASQYYKVFLVMKENSKKIDKCSSVPFIMMFSE